MAPGVDDDPTIDDSDVAYRRVRADNVNGRVQDGVLVATSAAFEDHDDGMSVFLESVLADLGLDWRSVPPGDGYWVARLKVGALRAAGCGVTRDPDPGDAPPHPCNPAHALVHLPGGLSRNGARRKQREIKELAVVSDPATQ